ncbi:MAG TPA: PEP-CTERM sorting domain-containing protein, partial [Lacipirellulaceae bacterium]|nr:PEP-CTERM sorting domain-containing protein [Lacipirellulaceae bacterium]
MNYTTTILAAPGYNGGRAADIAGGVVVGTGNGPVGGVGVHYSDALLWSTFAGNPISLNPGSNWHSSLYGMSSDSQVGAAANDVFIDEHAALWHSTAASLIDLNPTGYYTSQAYAVSGNTQVGGGGLSTQNGGLAHGLVWHGTAASAVDLTPAGYGGSVALDIDGDSIVGEVAPLNNGIFNASLWTGVAHTLTNLQPAGFASSEARSVSQNLQVGVGYSGAYLVGPHAVLWHGSAATAVDLNPAGFTMSDANGVAGNLQVGYGSGTLTGGNNHALLWQGTAASAFDLHSSLAGLGQDFVSSIAQGVDASGRIVGFATDANNVTYPVVWSPVPEPTSASLLFATILAGCSLRRRASGASVCCIGKYCLWR